MSQKDVVDSYASMIEISQKLAVEVRTSALTRLVWFVAIAGYVLLNAKPLWEALSGHTFSGSGIFWLSLPWVVSAFLGVITHFIVDEVSTRDNVYFTSKKTAVDLHKLKVEEGKEDPNEFIQIMNDTFPGIKEAKIALDRYARIGKWLERLTFLSLVFGFIWSLVGPLLLH